MLSDPKTITRAVHLIIVSRCLERIADHTTNIAKGHLHGPGPGHQHHADAERQRRKEKHRMKGLKFGVPKVPTIQNPFLNFYD